MLGTRSSLIILAVAGTFATAGKAAAQVTSSAAGPHTVIVRMVDHPGSTPFVFEPAAFTAQHGDTLRFVQATTTMHDVHFERQPRGAHLGAAAISPYLMTKGQTYTIVIDGRFPPGQYEIVCDPHEMVGMRAVLTVGPTVHVAGATAQP